MFISIISNAKSFAIKIYSFNSKNKEMMNKEFNRLHEKEKILWTEKFKIYDYSIFVI